MIKVNEYFEGKIKSLGFERHGTQYTAGVLLPGTYSIDTEKEEHITLTMGEFEIRPRDSDWKTTKIGEFCSVDGNHSYSRFIIKKS